MLGRERHCEPSEHGKEDPVRYARAEPRMLRAARGAYASFVLLRDQTH